MLALCFSAALSAENALSLTRVAIDAGHGGNDPGAVSRDRRTYEKNLTLDISRKFAERIKKNFPDVKVTLTRPDDSFVSLNDRAVRANKADAQLFISIHINSTASTSPNGYSMHVLGQSSVKDRDLFAYNMDVCRRENSVILLEDDYSTKYQGFDPNDEESFIFMQLMQNAHLEQSLKFSQIVSEKLASGPIKANRGIWQNPFYVLWKTAMPAVLLELGFISNQTDLSVLREDSQRELIVDKLLEAFTEYKRLYDGDTAGTETVPEEKTVQKPAVGTPETSEEPSVFYGVQIMAGKNRLAQGNSAFLGYRMIAVKVGDIYKYIIGVDDSLEKVKENKKVISGKYPSSFIVELKDKENPAIVRVVKGN